MEDSNSICATNDAGFRTIAMTHVAGRSAEVHASGLGSSHPFAGAQNHVPAVYAVVRNFLTSTEVNRLQAWFTADPSTETPLSTRSFGGDDISHAGELPQEPLVRQLYGEYIPFERDFSTVFTRLLTLKDRVGASVGLVPEELSDVTFAQDIRHITYTEGHSCQMHVDDPRSHFNVVMMLSRPEVDFGGGKFNVHPHPCAYVDEARKIVLQQGDCIIYSAPKVAHAIDTVTRGVRQICLVELRLPRLAIRDTPTRLPQLRPLLSSPLPFETIYMSRTSHPDRRRLMRAQLRQANISPLRRFVVRAVLSPHGTTPATGAEHQLAASHRALWRAVSRRPLGAAPLLIIQDDTELCGGDFAHRCAALVEAVHAHVPNPEERTAVLCIGGSVVSSWRESEPWRRVGYQILREAEVVQHGPSAYLVWPAAARHLMGPGLANRSVAQSISHVASRRCVRCLVAVPALAWVENEQF